MRFSSWSRYINPRSSSLCKQSLRRYSVILLPVIVERAKKCLDFTSTLYIIHLAICSCYDGIPRNWEWWILQIVALAVMVILGEFKDFSGKAKLNICYGLRECCTMRRIHDWSSAMNLGYPALHFGDLLFDVPFRVIILQANTRALGGSSEISHYLLQYLLKFDLFSEYGQMGVKPRESASWIDARGTLWRMCCVHGLNFLFRKFNVYCHVHDSSKALLSYLPSISSLLRRLRVYRPYSRMSSICVIIRLPSWWIPRLKGCTVGALGAM